MSKDSEFGVCEDLIDDDDKEFDSSPNPMGLSESNVDFSMTKAPKEANTETPEEG